MPARCAWLRRSPAAPSDADAVRPRTRWASVYDAVRRRLRPWPPPRRRRRQRAAGPGRAGGWGRHRPRPAALRRSKRVTGIDLSAEMLALARSRVSGTAGQRRRAAGGGRRGDRVRRRQFDIAVAMFVASVVPNPRPLLAEMRRVVRPGGTCCSSTTSRPTAARAGGSSARWRRRPRAGLAPGLRDGSPAAAGGHGAGELRAGAAARAVHPGAPAELSARCPADLDLPAGRPIGAAARPRAWFEGIELDEAVSRRLVSRAGTGSVAACRAGPARGADPAPWQLGMQTAHSPVAGRHRGPARPGQLADDRRRRSSSPRCSAT